MWMPSWFKLWFLEGSQSTFVAKCFLVWHVPHLLNIFYLCIINHLQATKGVMTCVSQEVKDLYNLLEHEFLPLDLASKVQPVLSKISKHGGKLSSASSVPEVQLSQYVPALEKLTTLRVLQQVCVFKRRKIGSFVTFVVTSCACW